MPRLGFRATPGCRRGSHVAAFSISATINFLCSPALCMQQQLNVFQLAKRRPPSGVRAGHGAR
jgi:hypothetical protein